MNRRITAAVFARRVRDGEDNSVDTAQAEMNPNPVMPGIINRRIRRKSLVKCELIFYLAGRTGQLEDLLRSAFPAWESILPR